MILDQEQFRLPQPEEHRLEEILDPKRCALLVVDLQNDFCDPQGKFAKDYKKDFQPMADVVPHALRLVDRAHQVGIQVIYTLGYEDIDFRDRNGKRRYIRHETLDGADVNSKKGTWGAKFYKDVQPQPGDIVLEKHKWSAFSGRAITNFDPNLDPIQYQLGDGLDLLLKQKDIQSLVVVGVKTEVCVDSTVNEAERRGYNVVIPIQAVGTDDQEAHQVYLRVWDFKNGDVIPEDRVLENWPISKLQ